MRRALAIAATEPRTVPIDAQAQAVAEDEPADVGHRRAERDPHAQLARALADRVGHRSVETDRGEQQRRARQGHAR